MMEDQNTKPKSKRSKFLLWFSAILCLAVLIWFLYWLLYLRFHESTDDAYANGNLININSAVSSSCIAYYADDTDLVEEGQLLVSLDTTNYQIAYDKELAALAKVVLDTRQLYTNVKIYQAGLKSKEVAFRKAKFDYTNRLNLVDSKAISNEDFTHSRDAYNLALFELDQAKYQLKTAKERRGSTDIEHHPAIEEQKARVKAAFYSLMHCSVLAPCRGYVAKRAVQVGQWVFPAEDLMAIIPADYVWVDANFKETQLTYMRIGQPATVSFDIYGSSVQYRGKVLGISSGTGSVFSVIPPQNATGNWIKIVQRLAVRVSLNPEDLKKYPTRLGLSAQVDVDISDQNLPMLAQVPSYQPVGITDVFDLQMKEVEGVIEAIIQENLSKKTQNGK